MPLIHNPYGEKKNFELASHWVGHEKLIRTSCHLSLGNTIFDKDTPSKDSYKKSKSSSGFICANNLASPAINMIVDPRIAVTETDCYSLPKDTDNLAGCKVLLSARVMIRLWVLPTISENPP